MAAAGIFYFTFIVNMDCSWSNSSSNILDLRFMPVCVETHNGCWCLKISKNVVPFRWIISKKDCVISVVDISEMKVANIDSKTARTVSSTTFSKIWQQPLHSIVQIPLQVSENLQNLKFTIATQFKLPNHLTQTGPTTILIFLSSKFPD